MRTPRRPRLALATALAVGVAACGASTALTDAMAARSAVMATMANPKVVTITFDAAVDLDELNQLVGVVDGADEPIDGDEAQELQTAAAALSGIGLILAHDDQSVRMAATWSGQPLVDIRMASDAPEDQVPTEPYDLTVAFRFDQDVVDQMLASLAPDGADVPEPGTINRLLRGHLEMLGLDDGPIADAMAAAEGGEWVTIEGTFDPETFGDALAITPGDTPDIDEERLSELFGDAVTLTDPEPVDGSRSRSSLTLDVGALVRGVVQLVSDADPSGDTARFLQGTGIDEFDLSIRDAMALTFDGDLLTEARIDLIDVGLQIGDALADDAADDMAAARQVMAGWTTTRLLMVASVSEHGTAGDQLADVSGGATLTWDDLAEVVEEFAARQQFVIPMESQIIDIEVGGVDASARPGAPPPGWLAFPDDSPLSIETRAVLENLAAHLLWVERRVQTIPTVEELDADLLDSLVLVRDGDVLRHDGTIIRFFPEGWDMCLQVDTDRDTLHMRASYGYQPMAGPC